MGRPNAKPDYSKMKYPNRCAEARVNASLTQQETADALGMSSKGYQLLEYGKRDLHSTRLKQLSALFGVTIDYLLMVDDETGE